MDAQKFKPGQILTFYNPDTGVEYDGIVWRVMKEDETNVSLVLRYVDSIGY